MPTTAAISGSKLALQEAATTGAGNKLAIPQSITKHSFMIEGLDTPSGGAVQPTAYVDADDTVGMPIGGGPILFSDWPIIYNFEGTFPFLGCPISSDVTSGSVNVIYLGAH